MDFKENLSIEEAAKAYYKMQIEALTKAKEDEVAAEQAAVEKAKMKDIENKIDKIFNL